MLPAPQSHIGPTTREILDVLQPQMNDLKDAVADIRDDTTYLRECRARDDERLNDHDRRIGILEGKKGNGNGKDQKSAAVETQAQAVSPMVNMILGWVFKFGLLFAVLFGLLDAAKAVGLLK